MDPNGDGGRFHIRGHVEIELQRVVAGAGIFEIQISFQVLGAIGQRKASHTSNKYRHSTFAIHFLNPSSGLGTQALSYSPQSPAYTVRPPSTGRQAPVMKSLSMKWSTA